MIEHVTVRIDEIKNGYKVITRIPVDTFGVNLGRTNVEERFFATETDLMNYLTKVLSKKLSNSAKLTL